jgi:hypothetical protein
MMLLVIGLLPRIASMQIDHSPTIVEDCESDSVVSLLQASVEGHFSLSLATSLSTGPMHTYLLPDEMSLLQHSVSLDHSISVDLDTSDTSPAAVATTSLQRNALLPNSSAESERGGGIKNEIPSLQPILFLKTHKTGSSTVTNIIQRMGERHNMSFMLPQEEGDWLLGYPHNFPGNEAMLLHGPPNHQFDIICDHAVLNIPLMYSYLKPNPHFITVVRNPTEQMISAKNYFFGTKNRFKSWDEYLTELEDSEMDGTWPNLGGRGDEWDLRFKNMQAFDLGWYDFVGKSTAFDHNHTKISEWLAALDQNLNSVVLMEHFEEGMTLFAQKIQVGLKEVSYVIHNSIEDKELPTEDQRQRLANLSRVDRALYAHLNLTFWQDWFSGNVSKLNSNVLTLKSLNEELQHACESEDFSQCPQEVIMPTRNLTERLRFEGLR